MLLVDGRVPLISSVLMIVQGRFIRFYFFDEFIELQCPLLPWIILLWLEFFVIQGQERVKDLVFLSSKLCLPEKLIADQASWPLFFGHQLQCENFSDCMDILSPHHLMFRRE